MVHFGQCYLNTLQHNVSLFDQQLARFEFAGGGGGFFCWFFLGFFWFFFFTLKRDLIGENALPLTPPHRPCIRHCSNSDKNNQKNKK